MEMFAKSEKYTLAPEWSTFPAKLTMAMVKWRMKVSIRAVGRIANPKEQSRTVDLIERVTSLELLFFALHV